jgi:hypothetical protein
MISYHLETDDILSLVPGRMKQVIRYRRLAWLVTPIALVIACVVLTPLFLHFSTRSPFDLVTLLAIALIVILPTFVGRRFSPLGSTRIPGVTDLETMVALGPSGLTQTIRGTESKIPWSMVTRIEERDGLLRFVGGERPVAYVPVRTFFDNTHKENFIAAAEAFRRGDPPPSPVVWPPPVPPQ